MNILEQLASGECFKVDIRIMSDVNKISYDLLKNKLYEDNINIYNDKEQSFEANIYSDNNRVKVKNSIMSGTSINVQFIIDTENLDEDDEIVGNISIVSTIGDISIPYKYRIVLDDDERVLKTINTIKDYYELYVNNYQLAKEIFVNKSILKSNLLNDNFAVTIYETLYNSSNKDIAIIEFFSSYKIDVTKYAFDINNNLNKFYDNSNSINNYNLDTETDYDDNIENVKEALNILDNIKDKDLIDNLAVICVRNNYRDIVSFNILVKTIENGTSINGLFEKLLYSIPKEYNQRLPLYVYKLYYEDKSYTFEQKANLYENIVLNFDENDKIYKLYNQEMCEFAISQICQNKISESLIYIYNKILTNDIVNENNYKNILYILRSHKIVIKDNSIKYVVIKYKELKTETKYEVINHIAYVPIFFDTYEIFFEDIHGNRFYTKEHLIKNLFEKKNLENYILENFPDENILDVSKLLMILSNNEIRTQSDLTSAKLFLNKLNINEPTYKKLVELLINNIYIKFSKSNNITTTDFDFIKDLKLNLLDNDEKRKVIKILLYSKEFLYVYNLINKYSYNLIDIVDRIYLYDNIINNDFEINHSFFNNDLYDLLSYNINDFIIIKFLTDYYDGAVNNLVNVLKVALENKVDVTNISRKLLTKMLMIGHDDNLDFVYSHFNSNNEEDNILTMAYLTKKCINYFLDEKELDERVFYILNDFLIKNINDLSKMPLIYLLAYSKYLSELDSINNTDMRRALIHIVDILLKKNYIFSYFKKLNKHVKMPYTIMNKEYIEYHSQNNIIPKAVFNINNGDDIEIELNRIYKNIYIRKITVYKNEIINYKIYDINNIDKGILQQGNLKYDDSYELEYQNSKIKNTYNYINEAINNLDNANMDTLKHIMIEMITRKEVSKQLFNI